MDELIGRRQFLATTITAGALSAAGCTQSGGNGTDTDETTASDGSSDTTTAAETTTGTGESDGTGGTETTSGSGASFDLNLAREKLPQEFESLVIEFTGFEFMDVYGSSVRRETEPVTVDLAKLEPGGAGTDLMETTVPAGSYDTVEYFISVADYTTTSGASDLTFADEGEVISELFSSKPYEVEAGESVTFTVLLSVVDSFSEDWQFRAGFTTGK